MRGHIRRRGRGSWAVVVELGRDPDTGRRRQKWLTVRGSRRDAERVLAETLAELGRGARFAPSGLTVAAYLARWYEVCSPAVRPSTRARWRRAVGLWGGLLGSIPLGRLTPLEVQEALRRLPPMSEGSVRSYFSVLRAALEQATGWGLLARNPARGVKLPGPAPREVRVWDEEQSLRFLEAARRSRLYALFHTALATGMRMGELLGLTWEDVDLEAGVIRVRRALATCVDRAGPPRWQEPKTAAARRSVAIGAATRRVLEEHRARQLGERARAGATWSDYGLVFCNRRGGPLFKSNVDRALAGLCAAAGLPRIRFHDLRHTHATLLLRQGVHPKVVAERLGHASVRITLDTYSHVLPDTQEEAARAADRVLAGRGVCSPFAGGAAPGHGRRGDAPRAGPEGHGSGGMPSRCRRSS